MLMLRFYEHSMHFLPHLRIFRENSTILITSKKAIEFDFPGNSDAQALLYEEIKTKNIDDDEKPQPAVIVDAKDELENNKTEKVIEYLENDVLKNTQEQLEEEEEPLELLLDFVESKGLKLKRERGE
jgi:hypothetical protein